MNRFNMVNVSLLLWGVIYAVAVDVKKEPTASSRLTARAAIDPWINLMRIPEAGDPTSQMFEGCIKNSRRLQYKPSSLMSPSTGFIYWRYELGQYGKNSAPSTWDKELNADDIFNCADAAANYRLFRFEGNKCSLSNMTFLRDVLTFQIERSHPEPNKDVLFINFEIPPSSCVGNGVFIDGQNRSCVNIVEFETPLDPTYWEVAVYEICQIQYQSIAYVATAALPMPTLQNYLRTKKITGEFLVGAFFDVMSLRVAWMGQGFELNESHVDASSCADYENKQRVVISSDKDYKLVAKDLAQEFRGVICAKVLS